MKTILLIGSSGFIGSHLKKELRKNYKLLCPSRKKSFDISNFKKINILLNKKIDIIINLSGQIDSKKNMFQTIVKGNQNIINSIKYKKKNPLIYFFSSTLVYGYSNKHLDEGSKLKPSLSYAKMKKISENQYRKSNLNYKILRLANVYSRNKKGIIKNLINSFISKKKAHITNVNLFRNYIHINDLIKVIKEMLKRKLKYNTYNISNENLSIKKIINLFEYKYKKKMSFVDKKQKLKFASSQKIKKAKLFKEINFKPKINLKKFILKEI